MKSTANKSNYHTMIGDRKIALHDCIQETRIDGLSEDTRTIKQALGYKEQSNGEFQAEVEKETGSLNDRLKKLEDNSITLNTKFNIIIILLSLAGIILGIIGGLATEILVKL